MQSTNDTYISHGALHCRVNGTFRTVFINRHSRGGFEFRVETGTDDDGRGVYDSIDALDFIEGMRAALDVYEAMSGATKQPSAGTRNIEIRPAVATVGYGYAMYASPADWREIAKEMGDFNGESPDAYIMETLIGYEDNPKVGIHFDAAQLVEVWQAIERLDFDPER